MAKLNAADRKALPTKDFAGPGRSYPVPDRSHAGNAKARASQMHKRGLISDAEMAKIDAKANKVLGKTKAADGDEKEDASGGGGMPALKPLAKTAAERTADKKRMNDMPMPSYDDGVTMHLGHDHLNKMGVGGALKSGQKVHVGARGIVQSSETRSDNGGDRHSATIRLTHMGVAGKGGK